MGEALVSVLDEKGAPTVVQKTLVRPPPSRLGPLTPAERAQVVAASPVRGLYDEVRDRDSAYEMLQRKAAQMAGEPAPKAAKVEKARAPAREKPSELQTMGKAFATSMLRTIGNQIGREIIRGVLGGVRRR